jgi:hypothetical protein
MSGNYKIQFPLKCTNGIDIVDANHKPVLSITAYAMQLPYGTEAFAGWVVGALNSRKELDDNVINTRS